MSEYDPRRDGPWHILHYERPFTQNALYGKSNKYHRAGLVKSWRESFGWLVKKERIPKLDRCMITAIPHLRDRRAQDTGACFPAVKAAIDGFVDSEVLPDDGPDVVLELRFHAPILTSELGDALHLIVERL